MTENIANLQLYNGFKLAAENLEFNVQLLNGINVFPVPDQDTGSNMAISMAEVARAINSKMHAGELFEAAAAELLRNGKGNSGTILALFFQGMAEKVGDAEDIDGRLLAKAWHNGALRASSGVSNPMDGTILTVAQKAGEEGLAYASTGSAQDVMERMASEAYSVLPLTALQNPVLAEYDVIDAGALGFCMIMDGLLAGIQGKQQCERDYGEIKEIATRLDSYDLVYNYCTEFVIDKARRSNAEILQKQLADLGDCIIPVEMDGMLKMHIHTDKPDAVFFIASLCGPIRRTKVDNMLAQGRSLSRKPMDIFLCQDELTHDGLLSMGYEQVFTADNIDAFNDSADELISGGAKVTLYTSYSISGDSAERFPIIRFFNSDEDLLTFVFSME